MKAVCCSIRQIEFEERMRDQLIFDGMPEDIAIKRATKLWKRHQQLHINKKQQEIFRKRQGPIKSKYIGKGVKANDDTN